MKTMYLTTTLALAALLMTAGCASKTVTAQEEIAAPTVTQTESQPASVEQAITDSKPAPAEQPAEPPQPELSKAVTVYFAFDSYVLTDQAKQQLKQDAEWLKAHPGVKATLEGYCDERGSDEYNLALGERRAAAAKSYLAEQGIAMERIATVSFGEERPVDPGHSELAWVKNRRVEFK